jgi:hypothetical protein
VIRVLRWFLAASAALASAMPAAAEPLPAGDLALMRARAMFSAAGAGGDATAVLRQVVARLNGLAPGDRREAHALLSRPTLGVSRIGFDVAEETPYCQTNACVHYVATTADAPPPADANANAVPDYVEAAGAELELVLSVEVTELGYRPPKDDLTSPEHGPDGRIDVYLADVGAVELFGYCTTDDPASTTGQADLSTFCVLDNDYAQSQYPGGAYGLDALRVTAAHELFHAVQAAYDFFEDSVLTEGTATWVEDLVYDDIDDNYRYLNASALQRPEVPLDSPDRGFRYGAFAFYRFVTESLASPAVIRRTWELADATQGGPDEYSLQAIDSALREQGSSLRETFAAFAVANAFPADSYEEGASYPEPPRLVKVVGVVRPSETGSLELDHLTSRYVAFRASKAQTAGTRLKVKLDLPPQVRGSQASLILVRRDGSHKTVPLNLSPAGDAIRQVPFDRSVREVILVLTNASARYNCFQLTALACRGIPRDDDLAFRYQARLLPAR